MFKDFPLDTKPFNPMEQLMGVFPAGKVILVSELDVVDTTVRFQYCHMFSIPNIVHCFQAVRASSLTSGQSSCTSQTPR